MIMTTRETDCKARQDARFINKEKQTAAKYLRRMIELPGEPEGMDIFYHTLGRIYVQMKGTNVPRGTKTVGTYCVMAPQELIYAAGAVPVKLCSGNYTAFFVGDDIAPRDACPLVKEEAGFKQTGLMPLYEDCSLMIVPVTCDCKRKAAGMLVESCEVMPMHVPASKGDDDIDEFVGQLYDMASQLEEVTGNQITYDSLAGIRKTGRAQYELSEFVRLRRQPPYLIRGTHAMAIMNASAYMPAEVWAEALHILNCDLKKRAEKGQAVTNKKLPRILLTGSSIVFPNMKIPLLIEEMGGIIAGDETCMGERGIYDPPVITDDSFDGMMRALANKALRPCPCPTFADNTLRIYRLKQLIKDKGANDYRALPDNYGEFLQGLISSESGETELQTEQMYVYGRYIDHDGERAVLYLGTTLGAVGSAARIIRIQLLIVTLLSVTGSFKSLYAKDGYTFGRSIAEGISVSGNSLRLMRAVYNLLDNAVRHTGADKWVGVSLRAEKRKGVSGLVLAIVNQTVVQHGGTCSAVSEQGKGSVFRIELDMI